MNFEAEKIKKQIKNGNFFVNNGRVLQLLDVLTGDFKKLTDLKFVLSDMEEYEIVKSVDYLHESGYIRLKNIDSGKLSSLSEASFKSLAAKLTADGIRVLVGKRSDDCIEL